MQEITLTLTIEEANQILDALGSQPFKSVFTLINKIQTQAAAQLQEHGSVSPAPKAPKQATTISMPGGNEKEGNPEK